MLKFSLLFVLLVMTSAASAQEPTHGHPVFATVPTVDRLDNGLTVVTLTWSTPGVVAYYTLVKVGSRDEVEPGRTGFAHLFEHMMFRGTRRLPGREYERALQSFGADSNAYIAHDLTLFIITAPSRSLPQLVEIEAQRFQALFYDQDTFRTETGAVLGEYNKGAANPSWAIAERLAELAFTRHTYGHTTMGYLQDICRMPELYEYSWQFYERFYTPDNTVIIAVGDVRREELLELVQTHYASWQRRRYDNTIPVEPEPSEGARAHLAWQGSTAPRLEIGYRIPAFAGSLDEPGARTAAIRHSAALEVIRALLFVPSSPLYQRLVVEEQVLLRLSSWQNQTFVDPSLFRVRATLKPVEGFDPATEFDSIIDAIQQEIDRIAAGEVPAERVDAVRSHIRYSLLTNLETPGRIADLLAHYLSAAGDIEALVTFLDALASLTLDEIASAASASLTDDRRFIVTLATAREGEEPMPRFTCASFDEPPPGAER